MAGQPKTTGPVAMSSTMTTNIYNNTSALLYDLVRGIKIVNKGASPATFSLWLGATGANAAGTELFTAVSVPVGSFFAYSWPGQGLKVTSTQFIVGGASLATMLTFEMVHEQVVV